MRQWVMSNNSRFTWDEAKMIANQILKEKYGLMNALEIAILQAVWNHEDYKNVAGKEFKDYTYIRGVASDLWKKLSDIWGVKVTRTKVINGLEQEWLKSQNTKLIDNGGDNNLILESPDDGPVGLNSAFYVVRGSTETDCYQQIEKPGALLRIKAPKSTGKTLLLNKIIAYAKEQDINFQAIILDFDQASRSVFTEYSKFLKWFCGTVGKLLELENQLNEYWDDDLYDEHTNTQTYFEDYLLKERTQPLILVLKNIVKVFEQENISIDFCSLLRAWSQLHTNSDRLAEIWKQVRIILVHSTDIYGSLNINTSPLDGVGLTVTLSDFTPEQIRKLEKRYQLQLTETEFNQFIAMFGGHPYFVQNALSYLKTGEHTLEHLLDIAPTEASPFKNHLRKHLEILQQNSELATAYYQVVSAISSVKISTPLTFKLESMGLVEVKKDDCVPRCGLYRQYFLSRIQP
jgi:serine/threonine-protein kinase